MAIIGIDLGTTNSCVAVIEGGDPVVIPNEEGSRTTPSVVAFTEDVTRLVGSVAKRQAVVNPENTIYAVKRLVGRQHNTDEVQKTKELVSYRIVPASNGDAWIEINGKAYSPQEMSAMVLTKMKQVAEDYLGYEVKNAVITVPAYFNDRQRQATKDAGRITGLDVRRIINEPTAAALAYGLDRKDSLRVAVFDLGGGTFDITILDVSEGVFEVRSTSGDTLLGGEDFDQRISEFVIEEFKKLYGIDLKRDPVALQRIKEAAERGKHELSSLFETTINLPFIAVDSTGPQHLNVKLTRAKFEELVLDLIDRLEGPCLQALRDAKLTPGEIDEVLLCGGMARMPKVQEKVKEIFGREPQKNINPDEVVAVGAAIHAGVLEGKVKEVLLLDVVPLSLGIETKGGIFTKIIERNTTIPTRRSKIFTTAQDNQTLVNVHVLQGERDMVADNISLSKFELLGIPPAPRGVPQIDVAFEVDADGILHVSAKDLGTGKEQAIRISTSSGLTEEEIQKMIKEAQEYAEEDKRQKEVAQNKNEAEGLLYAVKRSFSVYGDRADNVIKEQIEKAIKHMEEAISGDDVIDIRSAKEELQEASYRFAGVIYGGPADVSGGESEKRLAEEVE